MCLCDQIVVFGIKYSRIEKHLYQPPKPTNLQQEKKKKLFLDWFRNEYVNMTPMLNLCLITIISCSFRAIVSTWLFSSKSASLYGSFQSTCCLLASWGLVEVEESWENSCYGTGIEKIGKEKELGKRGGT